MRTNPSRLATALIFSLLLTLALAAPASADPLSAKRAQAARVQAQVDALNDKAEIASEKYNAARIRYNKLADKVRVTNRKISKIKKRQGTLQKHLNTRAVQLYREPFAFLPVLLGARSFEDFEATARMLQDLNKQDAATIADLKAAKAEAQEARKTLVAQKAEAGRHKDEMAANANEVKARLESRGRLLANLTSEIQALVARRIAEQAAAEQARTMRLLLRQRTAITGGIILGGPPPSDSKAAGAVYWAEKQLGKPYVWAADGPDTFDCSGLMMFAYAKVGIKLSHYSGSQINEGAHVSRSNLRPGDLVFFGSPIHHVGMYVGGGDFLEAPYSGATVRIVELSSRSDFAGACRPSAD
jgi:peptidoglycan DL-endopeptidase CwlO